MKNKKATLFVILGCILLIGITVSFAYYLASIQGVGKNITLKTKTLKITFTESNNLSGENITPGWSKTSTFTVKNEGKGSYSYNIVIKDLINTFATTGFLQYKITSTDGGYNMTDFKDIPKSSVASNKKLATNITIEENGTHTYTILFTYKNSEDNQAGDMGKILSGQIIIDEYTIPTLANQLLADNPTISTKTDFGIAFTETNTGTLYKATESIANSPAKDVYYFAGDAKNNWVKFGGFYWRIIRTNHDGSVRLLYAGTSPDTTEGYIGESAFNSSRDDSMYVGYMYGTTGSLASNRTNENNSTIKGVIDTWYSNNLSSYTKYISTEAVYCNDREVGSGTYSATGSQFYYAAYSRLNPSTMTPTYNCTNSKDAFSGSNNEAKLTYPIGLMTADEVAYAGGYRYNNLTSPYAWYYLNSAGGSITGSTYWWLLSPYDWRGNSARVWFVRGSVGPGNLDYSYVNSSRGVRPAISLKSCTLYSTGNGTASSPYEIQMDGGC